MLFALLAGALPLPLLVELLEVGASPFAVFWRGVFLGRLATGSGSVLSSLGAVTRFLPLRSAEVGGLSVRGDDTELRGLQGKVVSLYTDALAVVALVNAQCSGSVILQGHILAHATILTCGWNWRLGRSLPACSFPCCSSWKWRVTGRFQPNGLQRGVPIGGVQRLWSTRKLLAGLQWV